MRRWIAPPLGGEFGTDAAERARCQLNRSPSFQSGRTVWSDQRIVFTRLKRLVSGVRSMASRVGRYPSAAKHMSYPTARLIVDPVSRPDQIIDAATALKVQAEAGRTWAIVGWCVAIDVQHQPGRYVAHLLAGEPSPYVLVADSLDDLHALLPPGLIRLPGLPPDQPEIVALWFAP